MAEKGTGLPVISVLMPAYNAERYIEAAIRSLEEQTVENWELIVVDDCSTDGTAQLLRRLAAEDPRIRPIFSAENRGAAAAQEGMVAVQIVAAIAVGAAVTSVIFRALAQRGKREANSPKDAA